MYANKKLNVDMNEARRRLRYDADTGQFTWLFASNKNSEGPAGYQKADRYVRIKFLGKEYMAHCLAWAFVHGSIPAMEIDHINRDRADNRIANLRLVTRAENMANASRSLAMRNALGATRLKRGGRWQAQIQRRGHNRYLGTFATAEEASAAYQAARAEYSEVQS